MNHRLLACGLLVSALCAASASAAPERYQIDAQYRGMISKTFPAIGTAVMNSVSHGSDGYTLTASGEATHPLQKAKTYQATVNMDVRVTGGRVAVTSSTQKTLPGSEQFAQQMRDVMPILAVVRSRSDVAAGSLKALQTPGGPVQLATRQAGDTVEITAERAGSFVAKIFLSRRGDALRLERFRVPAPEDNVMLTFVPTGSLVSAAVLE